MKTLRLVALALLIFGTACRKEERTTTCGGPTYPCALRQTNAELTVIPLPNPIPSMGGVTGANNTVVPLPYGTTVIRCTDAATDPTNTKLFSFEVTDTGGDMVFQWNLNQRLLRVTRMSVGTTGIVGFDPATGKCTVMNPDSIAPAGSQWSLKDANVDFYEQGTTTIIKRTFDYTQPLMAPHSTTLFDFAKVCPMIGSTIPVKWNTQIVTNDDDLFSMAFGTTGATRDPNKDPDEYQGQDTAQYVVSYQMSVKTCWLWNTMTGHVLQSACAGAPVDLGVVSTFFPFTIHSMNQTPAGPLLVGVGATCTNCPAQHGPFFWYPRSTRVDFLTQSPVGGHSTSGQQTFVNITAAPKMAMRYFSDLGAPKYISDNAGVKFPTPNNVHISWQNGDLQDTYPMCGSESTYNLPQPPPITSPLQQEIYCTDPTNGSFIRITPTFVSGLSNPYNFRTQQAILANGRLGYIAFSSDWEGTLGNTDGQTAQCKLGAAPPLMCRSDVFIAVPH